MMDHNKRKIDMSNCPVPKNKLNLLVSDIKKEPIGEFSLQQEIPPNITLDNQLQHTSNRFIPQSVSIAPKPKQVEVVLPRSVCIVSNTSSASSTSLSSSQIDAASDRIVHQLGVPVDLSLTSSSGNSIENNTGSSSGFTSLMRTSTPVLPTVTSMLPSTPTTLLSVAGESSLSIAASIPNTNSLCPTTYTHLVPRRSIAPFTTHQRQFGRFTASGLRSVSGIPGVSDPIQLMHKVRQLGAPDLSTALRLDVSVLLNEAGCDKRFRDSHLSDTSAAPTLDHFGSVGVNKNGNHEASKPIPPTALSEILSNLQSGSRKGQHLCLFCQRSFSSAALFANHIHRPVARIIYRCHLCPNVSASQTVVVPALHTSTSSDPSGLLSATNLCAIYAHMALRHAHTHPNPADWRLVNSRLSVTALRWKSQGPLDSDLDVNGKTIGRPFVCVDLESEGNGGTGIEVETSQAAQVSFPIYIDGQELVDLRNDLDRTVTRLLRTNEFQFLPSVTSASIPRQEGSFRSMLRFPDIRAMATNTVFLPSPSPPDSLSSNSIELPSPGSARAHLLFRLAEASLWHGHIFLCGWNPVPLLTSTSTTSSPEVAVNKEVNISKADLDENEKLYENNSNAEMQKEKHQEGDENGVTVDQALFPSPVQPPSAASNEQLRKAVAAFFCDQSVSSTTSTAPPAWQSLLCPPSTPIGTTGFLRCLICGDFRTNSRAQLVAHLGGNMTSVPGKCALCSQSVAYNRTNFCSVKAHLLFHLGIYIMCPQCGFTPPPDLPPNLAELCLRVHLRFVCFHFNVVQVCLCLRPECRGKAYMTQHLFVQHWMDSHTQRRFACLLCHRAKYEEVTETSGEVVEAQKTTSSVDNASALATSSLLLPSAEAHKYPDNASIRRHLEQEHQVSEVQLTLATVGNFYAIGFVCSECGYVSATSIAFATHFTAMHCRTMTSANMSATTNSSSSVPTSSSPCDEQCCFRCFGNCKRIHNDLADYRAHQFSCPSSIRLLSATYGPLFRLSTTPLTAAELESEGSSSSGGNPLCFCLYCGIGARKLRRNTAASVVNNQSVAVSSSSSTVMPPLPSVSPVSEPGVALSSPSSSSEQQHQQRPTTPNFPTTNTNMFATSTFHDLEAVHAHERREHVACEGNRQIGCPWCPRRQACSKSEHLQLILDHIATHTKENPYVSWYLHRRKQIQENINDIVLCYCGTGLLDCPLALMAHATCEPTALTMLSDRRRCQLFPTTPTDLLGVNDMDTGKDATHESCSHSSTIRPAVQPGGHVPCSPAVYNHLRFGELPFADSLLKHYATGAQREFLCPLCSTIEMTRWALTEHAFHFHWTRLCYVCCDFVYTETNANSIVEPSTLPSSTNLLESFSNATGASDLRENSNCRPGLASQTHQHKESFWDHVYKCLTKRHKTLLKLHRSSEGGLEEVSSDGVIDKDIVKDVEDEAEEDLCIYSLGNGLANVESDLGDPPSVGVQNMAMSDESRPSSGSKLSIEIVPSETIEPTALSEMDTADDSLHYTSAKIPRLEQEKEIEVEQNVESTLNLLSNSTANAKLFKGCFLCGAKCAWDAYEEHMMTHQSPYMDCDTLLHAPNKNSLSGERPDVYKCYICYRRFWERSTCRQHMLVRHQLQKSDINWSELLETFRSASQGVDEPAPPPGVFHIASGVFTCAQCFMEFKTRRLLCTHVTEHHPLKGNGWRPMYCSDCGLSFLSDLSLRIHQRGAHHMCTSTSEEVITAAADDDDADEVIIDEQLGHGGVFRKQNQRSTNIPQIL